MEQSQALSSVQRVALRLRLPSPAFHLELLLCLGHSFPPADVIEEPCRPYGGLLRMEDTVQQTKTPRPLQHTSLPACHPLYQQKLSLWAWRCSASADLETGCWSLCC